jgi:hypothetical protein
MKKLVVAATVATAFPAALPAAQSDQFDLNCTGSADGYAKGKKYSGQPFKQTIHVDLLRGEYCIDECNSVSKINDVNSLQITFADAAFDDGKYSKMKDFLQVDRTTGESTVAYFNSGKLEYMAAKATCVPAPFTPFPRTKF